MPFKIEVQDGDRLLLSEILDALGQTQLAIAKAADVKRPWLSQVLKGQRKKVDGEMLERVADVFVDGLKGLQGNSRFPAERVQVVLASLSRFTPKAAAEVAPKIYPPGGLLAVDAAHYISRQADQALEDVQPLGRMPFTMLVQSPVQSGKSSLLAQLQQRSREVGIKTAWFDPTIFTPPETVGEERDVNASSAESLVKVLQEQWGLTRQEGGTIDSIPKVVHWLSRELAQTASTPRLLILDDLAVLGALAAKRWVSDFVRFMHNKRSTGGPQISMAVGFTHLFEVDFAVQPVTDSSVVHWWPRVELPWLTETEVRQMESTITGSITSDDLYELFGGQPYLTHAALAIRDFRDAVRKWTRKATKDTADAVRRSAPYKRHLSAIRHSILGRSTSINPENQKVLKAFIEACSGKVPPNSDLEVFLETYSRLIKVVNKNGKKSSEPALKVYRLIADDLTELEK